jgi:hypothetical protein
MSTILEAFQPIAKIANSYEETIVSMSSEAFGKFKKATPGDVVGLFKTANAVDLVWAGYICSKATSVINGDKVNLTYREIKPYLEAIRQFRSQITIHASSVMMIAELITWDNQVVEAVPVLDRQLSTIKNALVKALDDSVTKDPAKVAQLRLDIMELLPKVFGVEAGVLQNA